MENFLLSLSFDARLDTVEGILSVIQEWAAEQGIPREDGLSLRLVLDELLTNICMHAGQPEAKRLVDLRLQYLPASDMPEEAIPGAPRKTRPEDEDLPQGIVRISLRDTAPPFNPFAHAPEPVSDIGNTPVGGRGLTLVRLLTTAADYQWTGSGNCLNLDMPLVGNAAQSSETQPGPKAWAGSPRNWLDRLRALWAGNLALRQTVRFTVSAIVLLWGGMALYLAEVKKEQTEGARTLANQAMFTQSNISSHFVARVAKEIGVLVDLARNIPDRTLRAQNPDALVHALEQTAAFRSLTAELPILGVAAGQGNNSWLYRSMDGQITRQPLQLPATNLVAPNSDSARWKGLFLPFKESGPHAAMIYAVSLTDSGNPDDGWIGAVLVMPWIQGTLKALSGFKNAIPFFLNATGHYVIYPAGRQLGQGPQSLAEEATELNSPGLATLEKNILAGNKGVQQLRPVFHGDPTPWDLPWKGPTSLAYYPMHIPGWYLCLLVSSNELGDAPHSLPTGFFWLAILGPACIGSLTWLVTSRTLRPLHELVGALERFGRGDMNAPFPTPHFADEIGVMLATFERVRATVRASFKNLVNTAAEQQRIQNELALARNIQKSMLPGVFPDLPWAAVHADIEMSREVCGDLYDCFAPDADNPERLCFVMGDVCGKGVPAAIIMSRTMTLARAFLQEGLSPAETLARLNNALLRSDNSSMFVTMLVGILEPDGSFCWSSAGHPPPLAGPAPLERTVLGTVPDPGPTLFSPQLCTMPPWPGELVLGVRSGQKYSTFTIHLAPGQSLLLYTDGADEAQGPPRPGEDLNELYGDERLTRSFDQACRTTGPLAADQRPAAIVAQVRSDIVRHMAGQTPVDDISLMVVCRTSGIASS